MAENIVFVPAFKDSPSNPARCFIPTGRIEVNASVWPFLTEDQRNYVLNHERGHRDLKTYNELAADDYALQKMALKKPYSLINHINSVKMISKGDKKRVYNAQKQVLRIAAADGSLEAKQMLQMPYYANANGERPINWVVLAMAVIVIIILIYLIWKRKK